MMNKTILLMIFFSCFVSENVSANGKSNFKKLCDSYSSGDESKTKHEKNVRIESYSISTITQNNLHGFGVVIKNLKYRMIIKTGEGSKSTEQFSDIARMAKVLNLPVNVCVDNKKYDEGSGVPGDKSDGRLLGIEIS
ncbi:hypothetical protein [Candidatus Symbiopectobacterium sp. NZEC135]|uniref:hypothetical protein n=1 Tax=Candidatus Symbiopectobacterium sp. NZEC135 TaxID=2820471 RepID=UPI002226B0B4|nr:hypothetical protein [Candidatus Symbiopectobacterium sp. NZEC135]MCW2481382.1 hypothetical protein [Candidatus Symbiopectobacterium sp. NZEC135]